jgi:hypothetical protein
MRRLTVGILGGSALLAAAAIYIWYGSEPDKIPVTRTNSDSAAQSTGYSTLMFEGMDFSVDAEAVSSEFLTDYAAAKIKYGGKTVLVRGKIASKANDRIEETGKREAPKARDLNLDFEKMLEESQKSLNSFQLKTSGGAEVYLHLNSPTIEKMRRFAVGDEISANCKKFKLAIQKISFHDCFIEVVR